jgi:hypothetical protein
MEQTRNFDWNQYDKANSVYALMCNYDETTSLLFMSTNLSEVYERYYFKTREESDPNASYYIMVQSPLVEKPILLQKGADLDVQ